MPTYHCEVFKQDAASPDTYLVFNLTNHESPTFSLTSLEAGVDYHIVVRMSCEYVEKNNCLHLQILPIDIGIT